MDADPKRAEVSAVRLTDSHLVGELADGREIATPLAGYPRLEGATSQQRLNFEISPFGIHWPHLDGDLSVEGMLSGRRAVGA